MSMIQTKGLNAGYGKFQVLYDINFSAGAKDITVVLGPNGSGKSTLLKSIMGLTSVYSGSVEFGAEDITKMAAHKRSLNGIAYLPQTESVFSTLTVRENLKMSGHALSKEEYDDRVAYVAELYPIIKDCYNQKLRLLSGGERQMVAMGMSLLWEPKVILFDEPTSHLAPKVAFEVLSKIVELKDSLDLTLIVVEQAVKQALEIGTKAYLLANGRTIFEGDAQELLTHKEFSRMYLGLT
ncbi:MAG: ABC transporter ATP-binding protein [Candidatus Heimdallarchaeota archaeon]